MSVEIKNCTFSGNGAARIVNWAEPTPDGQDLVAEYTATLDRIADQAADRAAIVRTRLASLEAELVVLDGLATQLGETT